MLVSVIIPTKGERPDMIKEAIASVESQTLQPCELLIYGPEHGVNKINKAITKSKGDAFLLLSDDDILEDTYIQRTAEEMVSQQADIVATALRIFGKGFTRGDNDVHGPGKHPFFTSLCKKSMWEKAGKWDQSMGGMADAEFWYRCFKAGGTWSIIGEPLYNYRKHPTQDSLTVDWKESRKRIIEKHPEYEF